MIDIDNINLTESIASKLDKSSWKIFKFSDLVENIVEKVVPKNSGLKHYIGLEHLDSGSLKINRYGETESLIGDKLKIYKGDLIFAKRNSYLKRVAIADFDAVASAHSMVLRPKAKNVDPAFLPFFMMSEVFWKRAIEISVGSLSPTINWKSLAKQEFHLPPKAEQARLAELLWAMDDVIEKEKKINSALKILKWSEIKNEYLNKIGNYSLEKLTVDKYGIVDGPFGSNLKTIHYKDSGIPVMQSGYVTKGYFEVTDWVYVDEEKYKSQIRSSAISGDILMAKIGANYGECAIIPLGFDKTLIAGNSIRIRVNNQKCITNYMLLYLKFQKRRGVFEKHVTTTAQPALTISALKKLKMFLPSLIEQEIFITRYKNIQLNIDCSLDKIKSSKSLQKSLINQIF